MTHLRLLPRLCLSRYRHLLSAALDDELDQANRHAVEKHLERCTRCAEEMEELRFARNAIRRLEIPVPQASYSGIENLRKVSADLRQSFNLQEAAMAVPKRQGHSAGAFVVRLAAAACILFVVALVVYLTKSGIEKSPPSPAGSQLPLANANNNSVVVRPPISGNANSGSTPSKRLATGSRRKLASGYRDNTEVPQRIELPDPIVDADLRGSEVRNPSSVQYTIVRLAFKETPLTIDLPDNSKTGTYVVELQTTARFERVAPLSTTESDGEILSVKLRLQRVRPGDYILFVGRKNSSGEEYIGRFPVSVADPDSHDGTQ